MMLCRSVLNANVHILLALWDVLELLVCFPCGQLVDGVFEDLERALQLVFGDDKRWSKSDNVLMCWLGLVTVSVLYGM